MTDELTLREKVLTAMVETAECAFVKDAVALTDAIATILEDTGSPAHMRVAADLRGIGRFKEGDSVVSLKDFGPVDGWPNGIVRSADPAFKGAVQVKFKTAIILHQPHELRGG